MVKRYWIHLWTEMSDRGRRTFPWDVLRGAAGGAMGTLQATFGLLVAIQHFDASVLQKSLVAGSFAAGLLLSLFYAAWSPVFKKKTVRAAAPLFGAAAGLLIAASAHTADTYTLGTVVFGVCTGLPVPIMTGIYRDNYKGAVRGQVFGITVLVTVCAGLATQFAGGGLLERSLELYRPLYVTLAALTAVGALSILRMPNKDTNDVVQPNPLHSFRVMRENPMFGYVLFAWFLFGFANLSLQPQRIEYLSQAQYGLSLSPGAIVLIVGVCTELARLAVIPLWARLFDHYNFVWLRIWMCGFLLTSILIYYHTTSVPLLVLGALLLGTAFGGGAIAWALWVTKFAPAAETARYMSVHSFFTGVRGSLGPLLGYLLVQWLGIQATATLAAAMIGLAMFLLWLIRNQATRPATECAAHPASVINRETIARR